MSIFDIFQKLEAQRATAPTGKPTWMIVGLGNPGSKYEGTRHNAGFRAVDSYCARTGARVGQMKFKALLGTIDVDGQCVLLLKPQTFMNLSGEAVQAAASFYKIPTEHIIVLSDDISLPVGTLRVRPKGSAGGQNGLKHIIQRLGTDEFPRVKIGVGQKPHPDYDLADWVLSRFTAAEQSAIDRAATDAMAAAVLIVRQGCAAAAQEYNGKRI